MNRNRYTYWGPHPWEQDGGAVVNYYLLKKQNELRPLDEYWGVPKVYEELDASSLPWVNYPVYINKDQIAELMSKVQSPILNIFHIGHTDFEKVVDDVHDIGGKVVLHQTIHWPDDTVLKSERLNDIDIVVAPTEYAKRVFQVIYKMPLEKITVIPHGVDITKFYRRPTILRDRLGIKPHQKVILYSGRLGFWKGVHEIPSIIRRLVREFDCVFIIRGGYFPGNPEGEALYKLFKTISNGNPNVIFIPEWQPPEFMEELYSMVDILIFNSGHEGFGVPLIEAQAVKAIPVTTTIDNHVEILGMNGLRGLLVEPEVKVGEVNDGTDIMIASSEQLYGQVKWVLDNPEEAEIMGERGRKNVEARFSLEKVAKVWLELYDWMIPQDYSMDEAAKERLLL